jgi:nicotinamidase-related amidase
MTENSIYLVLDMENDIIHEDGPNGKAGYGLEVRQRGVIAKTQTALAKARARGVRIGYVRVGFSPDYRECPPNSPIFSGARERGLFKLGSWGLEVHPEIAPQEGDFDIVKHRVSPFYGTNLEPILRANAIGRIYLSGVSTNAVVQATVREGHDRDYEMVLLEDCSAALSAEEHAMAVESLRRFCTVTTAAEVDFSG